MQGQRRPPHPSRPPGPSHGSSTHPPIQWAQPKLWTMQTPKLPTEEPFIPDLHVPNGTDQEDKLSSDMIEHGYRDPLFVRHLAILYVTINRNKCRIQAFCALEG